MILYDFLFLKTGGFTLQLPLFKTQTKLSVGSSLNTKTSISLGNIDYFKQVKPLSFTKRVALLKTGSFQLHIPIYDICVKIGCLYL